MDFQMICDPYTNRVFCFKENSQNYNNLSSRINQKYHVQNIKKKFNVKIPKICFLYCLLILHFSLTFSKNILFKDNWRNVVLDNKDSPNNLERKEHVILLHKSVLVQLNLLLFSYMSPFSVISMDSAESAYFLNSMPWSSASERLGDLILSQMSHPLLDSYFRLHLTPLLTSSNK